jgi:substrate-binding family protein
MHLIGHWIRQLAALATAAGALIATSLDPVAADPIKVGFSMALTGAYAGNGKAALLATQMWAEDQNAKGGLLGRPVQLVFRSSNRERRSSCFRQPTSRARSSIRSLNTETSTLAAGPSRRLSTQ